MKFQVLIKPKVQKNKDYLGWFLNHTDKRFVSSPGHKSWSPSYKTFFMLNSAEHEIYHACECWHFDIYKHEKCNIWDS